MKALARGVDGLVQAVSLSTGHEVTFDEPRKKGGQDSAPSPAETVAAALAACTAITLRMYAGRKGWDLSGMEVTVDTAFDGPNPIGFEVKLDLPGGLDYDQVDRLRVIAAKCPVHRVISEATEVTVS